VPGIGYGHPGRNAMAPLTAATDLLPWSRKRLDRPWNTDVRNVKRKAELGHDDHRGRGLRRQSRCSKRSRGGRHPIPSAKRICISLAPNEKMFMIARIGARDSVGVRPIRTDAQVVSVSSKRAANFEDRSRNTKRASVEHGFNAIT
jgi:hypothetical protein